MKVGDYERTNYGTIAKIEEIYEEYIVCDKGYVDKEDIIKSSPNIIDLIEVGDYVNGMKITDIKKDLLGNVEYVFGYSREGFEGETMYYEKDIKSVLTHEQFESMQYNLESEVN